LEKKPKQKLYVKNPPPPPEKRDVYEVMWKNVVEPGMPQMTIWGMQDTEG